MTLTVAKLRSLYTPTVETVWLSKLPREAATLVCGYLCEPLVWYQMTNDLESYGLKTDYDHNEEFGKALLVVRQHDPEIDVWPAYRRYAARRWDVLRSFVYKMHRLHAETAAMQLHMNSHPDLTITLDLAASLARCRYLTYCRCARFDRPVNDRFEDFGDVDYQTVLEEWEQ